MSKTYTSTSPTSKDKRGSGGLKQAKARQVAKPSYAITDSFASKAVPAFAQRKHRHNPKGGFYSKPTGINKETSF